MRAHNFVPIFLETKGLPTISLLIVWSLDFGVQCIRWGNNK